MSIIPTTSRHLRVPYTVIGEPGRRESGGNTLVTVVVLNRGERLYKENQFLELENSGIGDVISIEPPDSFYDVEAYARRFKKMKFIVPSDELTPGETINLAVEEAQTPLVLVIWNNMHLPAASFSRKIMQRALENGQACTVPCFYSRRNDPFPNVHVPALYKRKRLQMISSQPNQNNLFTLFPHDYCGFYNKKIFQELGGFDHSISTPYWQLMDFGLRAYMWGFRFQVDLTFRMNYQQEIEPLDRSVNNDYFLFYLKNLALRFKKDRAYLPGIRFFRFRRRSSWRFGDALMLFREVRHWVRLNRFRYIQHAASVVNLWDKMESE